MSIEQQQVTDEQDELIDATIAKIEQSGDLHALHAQVADEESVIRETRLHGVPVQVTKRVDEGGQLFISATIDRKQESLPGYSLYFPDEYVTSWPAHGGNESEQGVFDRVLAEADKRALMAYVSNAASAFIYSDPDLIVYDEIIGEYWKKVCEHACMSGKVVEDQYVVDITATMTSPEVGPQMGGDCSVDRGGGEWFETRCRLVHFYTAEETGGRWLAVYEVQAA